MTTRSKRSAFRFDSGAKKISYITAEEEGNAELLNISTIGCALVNMSQPVEVGEKILLRIATGRKEGCIEAQATIIRIDKDSTAARFTLCEKETEAMIRSYFSTIHRRVKTRK